MLKKVNIVLALGYFDSVHKGHLQVIAKAQNLAKEKGLKCAVLTFDGDLKGALNMANKPIFTLNERVRRLKNLGVDDIIFLPTDKEFLSLDKEKFLEWLNEKYNISGYVCGSDYTFGLNGKGDAKYLKEYATLHFQTAKTVDLLSVNGKKISTTAIKNMLKSGLIKEANSLLSEPYAVTGKVFEDRKIGVTLGFPTINLKTGDISALKNGVYFGHIILDNKYYKTIINYGARPTFNLKETLLEAHIIDFNGALYGKTVTVFFDGYLRDIVKFSNADELSKQLKYDKERVKNTIYD